MAKVNIKSEKTTPFRLFYYSYVCRQENIILFIYIILLYILYNKSSVIPVICHKLKSISKIRKCHS